MNRLIFWLIVVLKVNCITRSEFSSYLAKKKLSQYSLIYLLDGKSIRMVKIKKSSNQQYLTIDSESAIEYCEQYGEPRIIVQKVKQISNQNTILTLDNDAFDEIINICSDIAIDRKFYEEKYNLTSVVISGTKWCGAGNVAANESDVSGIFPTDKCCRDHDKCEPEMYPGESFGGLTNNGPIAQ